MAKKKKTKSIFGMGMHTLINWGATVVIVGLMFKILHFKGGEWMIGVGLAVEALLFFVMGFMRTDTEPDWTRVYPELDEGYEGEPTTAKVAQPVGLGGTATLDKMLHDARIDQNLIGSLGDGLRIFSDKVAAISRVSDTTLATDRFAAQLSSATDGAAQLSRAFDRAATDIQSFGDSSTDFRHFKEQLNTFNRTLTSLNAIYGNMLSAMNSKRG